MLSAEKARSISKEGSWVNYIIVNVIEPKIENAIQTGHYYVQFELDGPYNTSRDQMEKIIEILEKNGYNVISDGRITLRIEW